MATMYEITEDLKGLNDLLMSLEDEDGNPREPTQEELETMKKWFDVSNTAFEDKFDSYCKFIKNLKMSAENVEAERSLYKKELDRLKKRADAFENRRVSVQGLLRYCMENLKIKKHKTELFSAGIQNTQKKVSAISTCDLWSVPRDYLKTPELDTNAIRQDLKDGVLYQKETADSYGKLFYKEAGEEKELFGITCIQGDALVIR